MIGSRKVDKPLVLYGYGRLGKLAEEIFNELNIPVANIVSKEVPWVLMPENTGGYKNKVLLAICVATELYAQVTTPLTAAGWQDIVPCWEIVDAYPEAEIHNGWTVCPTDDDTHETYSVMGRLADDLSQRHYGAFMDWHISHYEHRDLAIEVSKSSLPSTLADIRQRQKVIIFADTPLIKAVRIHAEGYELKTLEENIHIFKKYRPSIECACYHSRDGLWKIEKFLMDSLPDYTWTFRLHSYQGQSAYIYGCPKEILDK